MQVYLTLANGQQYIGSVANYATELTGELVFNTGMTGYEETLTDPSYAGQILVFTYPLIGNYGVGNVEWLESDQIHVKAVICNLVTEHTQHHQAEQTLRAWLTKHNIPLITGIDTRQLTKELRLHGTMLARISAAPAAAGTQWWLPSPSLRLPRVGTTKVIEYGSGQHKIIVLDCGIKQSIIRYLLNFDVSIKQVPYNYDYTQENYAGLLLSNGPGNPADYTLSIEILRQAMQQQRPIFGICLGSQLLGLAAGATTYKLKFGHRGQNQPCQDTHSLKCYLTAQNHSYAIAEASLPPEWQVSFKHLHDGSVAGIRHCQLPYSAVQFHPEAAAGPNDTAFLFDEFYTQIRSLSK